MDEKRKNKDTRKSVSSEEKRIGADKQAYNGLSEPAADEAVKAALDMAQSVGPNRTVRDRSLMSGLGDYGDSFSISQYIEEAEVRAQSLFEQALSDEQSPQEDLDVLDVAAEFGRPDESSEEASDEVLEADADDGIALEKTQSLSVALRPALDIDGSVKNASEDIRGAGGDAVPVENDAYGVQGDVQDEVALLKTASIERHQSSLERRPSDQGSVDLESITGEFQPDEGDTRIYLSPREIGVKQEDAPRIAEVENFHPELNRETVLSKMEAIDDGTYFDILGLSADASTGEVHAAYEQQMRLFSEKNFLDTKLKDLSHSGSVIRELLSEAAEILSCPTKRELYKTALLKTLENN